MNLLLALFVSLLVWVMPGPAAAQDSRVLEAQGMNSRILGRAVHYSVYLPQGFDRDKRSYPVVILLHGAADGSAVDWFRFVALDRLLDRLIEDGRLPPLVAVAPDSRRPGDDPRNTYFLNDAHGRERWEDMFLTEFLPHVTRRYRLIDSAESRALLGISMGGFAAVLHHMRHPERFGAAASLSGAFRTDREIIAMPAEAFDQRFGGAFGTGLEGEARLTDAFRATDPARLAAHLPPQQMDIWIDLGADDPFFEGNAALHLALRDAKIPHRFSVGDGGHNWTFWDGALEPALLHLGDHLRRRP